MILCIEETVAAFYQQKEHEGYERLGTVLEGLMVMQDSLLTEKLLMAMEALERKDSVLLADILNYEIKPRIR